MKLNNIIKKATKLLLVLAVVLLSIISVSASTTAPKTINLSHYTFGKAPVIPLEAYHIKYITDTKEFVYCLTYAKKTPDGVDFTLGKKITDAGIDYILAQGANNKTDLEYYITQSALWIYMMDKGLAETTNSVNYLKTQINSKTDSTSVAIQNLVSKAKTMTSTEKELTLTTSSNNLTFTLNSDKTYYVSNNIKVNSNGLYAVSITNAPTNTVKEDTKDGFIIKVPASSINALTNDVSVNITVSKTVYNSYEYNPSNSKYQIMSYTMSETLTKKVTLTGSIKNTQVTISKIDVTNGQELPGAKLKLECNDGSYIKEWTSTTKPVVLTDVPEGTCSLTETIAPEGYVTSTETIVFKVVAGKATATQIMKNAPEKEETFDVEISKIDITDSKELPGAKLEITDKEGNVVCNWTSDGKIHTCKNLLAGTYTLTEITAPDGYEVAESITFEIDEEGILSQNGEVKDKIIMVDKPIPTIITEVPDTLSFKNTTPYIIGLIVILSGVGMIVRTVKRNEQ